MHAEVDIFLNIIFILLNELQNCFVFLKYIQLIGSLSSILSVGYIKNYYYYYCYENVQYSNHAMFKRIIYNYPDFSIFVHGGSYFFYNIYNTILFTQYKAYNCNK